MYVVVDGTGKPLGAFRTKAQAQATKASWARELKASGRRSVYDRLKIVKRNPSVGRVTKAAKREKTRKASVQRRVALALAKFLKQANPAMKTAGAQVQRLKGGVLKITPIKANRARVKR
jgi:hypothetical protein